MEKELDTLVDYFERLVTELKSELELQADNNYLTGKMEGIKQALIITRMYNIEEKGRHQIDVIIDTPILQNTSKDFEELLKKIIEMDPMIKKANDKLMMISADPEFVEHVRSSQEAADGLLRKDLEIAENQLKSKFLDANKRTK